MPYRKNKDEIVEKGSYEDYAELLEKYSAEDYPYYEANKVPNFVKYQEEVGWLDEMEKYWGKDWGSQGIGRLTDVAVRYPMPHEVHPMWSDDSAYFMAPKEFPSIEEIRKNHDMMTDILKEEGVNLHWWEFDFPPEGPHGLLKRTMSNIGLVINGGAIMPRAAAPWIRGRTRHAMQCYVEMGIPILLTIHGHGIHEIGATQWLAENIWMTYLSTDGNQEAIDQITPVMHASGVEHIQVTRPPGPHESFSWRDAHCMHLDMWFAPVDIGLVLLYPGFCDYETQRWLKSQNVEIIEVSEKEQRESFPCNLIILEPGKVMINGAAKETIKNLESRGIETIPVDFDYAKSYGGGIKCATSFLRRDEGPHIEELGEGSAH